MDAKGAKDTLAQHHAGRVIPSGSEGSPVRNSWPGKLPGRSRRSLAVARDDSVAVLTAPQSFAALASFASLTVCSGR